MKLLSQHTKRILSERRSMKYFVTEEIWSIFKCSQSLKSIFVLSREITRVWGCGWVTWRGKWWITMTRSSVWGGPWPSVWGRSGRSRSSYPREEVSHGGETCPRGQQSREIGKHTWWQTRAFSALRTLQTGQLSRFRIRRREELMLPDKDNKQTFEKNVLG